MSIARNRYIRNTRVSTTVIAGLGISLLIFAWMVYRFPLFCTLGGLILCLVVTITLSYL